jgi:hypothetical protein
LVHHKASAQLQAPPHHAAQTPANTLPEIDHNYFKLGTNPTN